MQQEESDDLAETLLTRRANKNKLVYTTSVEFVWSLLGLQELNMGGYLVR